MKQIRTALILTWAGLVFALPAQADYRPQTQGTVGLAHLDDFRHGRSWSERIKLPRDPARDTYRHMPAGIPAEGELKTVVALFNFSDKVKEPITTEEAKSAVFTAPYSMNAYFQEQSVGELKFIGQEDPTGDVYGWYTIPYSHIGCHYQAWAAAVGSALRKSGHNLRDYREFIFIFPFTDECDWGGINMGHISLVNGTPKDDGPPRTVMHEVGHSLGLHHSSALRCYGDSGQPVAISPNCALLEYGDKYDVMGLAETRHHNNWQKLRLGFLPSDGVQTVKGDTTVTLTASEQPELGSVQAIRVPRRDSSGQVGDFYYVDLRQPFGQYFDNFASDDPAINGVAIRLAPTHRGRNRPRLLDMTPSTDSFDDATLSVGHTFTDGEAGLEITLESLTSLGATVKIDFPDRQNKS